MENIIEKLLHDFENGKMNRRQLVQSLSVAALAAAPAAAAGKGFQTIAVNHISYQVADYAKTRDFYADLMGMKVSHDEGKGQCYMSFGDTFLLPRTPQPRAGREGKQPAAPPRPPQQRHPRSKRTDRLPAPEESPAIRAARREKKRRRAERRSDNGERRQQ